MTIRFILTALVMCFSGVLTSAASQAAAPDCKAAIYRQFDFWIGDWNVYDRATGKQLQGTNNITLDYAGCVLQEHWNATDGSSGSSFNVYDRSRNVWHQTWVDTFGQLLLLDGGMQNGSMILRGKGLRANKSTFYNRITWTPMPDGSVRQHWERSPDLKKWTDVFDGLYIKKKS